jgi:hypothetical protein
MSRISNNTFKVNSSLEQMTEISAVKAGVTFPISSGATLDQNLKEVNGSTISLGSTTSANSLPVVIASDQGSVAVSDSTAQASLSTIAGDTTSLDSKITSGSDATLASAQQAGIYGYDGSAWRRVAVNSTGHVKIEAELEAHSGSQGNLSNASSVVSGDVSTAITPTTHTLLTVFGNTTGTAGIIPQISADGTNYYPGGFEIYPDSNGDFFQSFSDISANNFRLKYQDTARS